MPRRSRISRQTAELVRDAVSSLATAIRQDLSPRTSSAARERLFGGMPTSYEVCTLTHNPSDTQLTFDLSGMLIRISGRQGRTSIQDRTMNFDNGLEAVKRYQELVSERLLGGFTMLHGGAAARRVLDRLPDIQEYFEARTASQQRVTDRRLARQMRPTAAQMVQNVRAALQSLPDPDDSEDETPPVKPAETGSVSPGLMSKLGGKRKLLRDE